MAARRPMNFMQIAEALRTRGIVFPDKPEQRVRWAMKHHREMFERVARGTYVLREWPAELKQKA